MKSQCVGRAFALVARRGRASASQRAARRDAKPKAADPESEKYRDTVLLPVTGFSQRANSVEREPQLQTYWEEERVYEKLAERATGTIGPQFTLHDGPPYANGDLHIGHALNKILKDFINRYRILRGDKVRFVPGWDCHGLPIELKVLQSINAAAKKAKTKPERLEPLALRERAATFARETVDAQRASFQRYGVWADWASPYLTLQPEYEAAQIGVFAKMYEKGYIYRGLKPVWYSPSSRTALAEAELEYPDGHVSASAYVGLKIDERAACLPQDDGDLELAVWTTTPWTLPANLAVAVGDRLDYCVMTITEGGGLAGRRLVVASELAASMAKKLEATAFETSESFKGEALASGTTYHRPVRQAENPDMGPVVVGGDYITAEGGTGLVHTAPGHGADDYLTGVKYGLAPFSPVDSAGEFTAEAGEGLEGLSVMTGDGGAEVERRLGASLLRSEPYAHRYPYDWRTKKPVIQRATSQWFASVDGFRNEAMAAIEGGVTWLPAVGKNRIGAMTEKRGDWCISRQRTWGVPLPVFYRKSDGEPVVTAETLAHVQSIVRDHGTDAWFALSVAELLPESMRGEADDLDKGLDTMDVWFDSGTSWAGVVEAREELSLPADLYLEGSDQHRGWFQSSLLTSVACTGKAPYKAVLTHGFVLDEAGFKMSKSLGNVVDPATIISGGKNEKTDPAYGADVMRLWVASVDYTADVRIGANALKQVQEQYRKLRNTMRYVLGNVHDVPTTAGASSKMATAYDAKDPATYAALPSLDKWLLGRLGQLEREVAEAYDAYQFARATAAVTQFVNSDLSAFYLDVAKDRLYVSPQEAHRRVQCQAVLVAVLDVLPRLVAPILPHLCEEIWHAIPYHTGAPFSKDRPSVFDMAAAWDPQATGALAPFAPFEEDRWAAVTALRNDANRAMEAARSDKLFGASLGAEVVVAAPTDPEAAASFAAALGALLDQASSETTTFEPHVTLAEGPPAAADVDNLRFLLLVSRVTLVDDAAAVLDRCGSAKYVISDAASETRATVGVRVAEAQRCARCWYHDATVGASAAHPSLCARCDAAVADVAFPESESVQPAAVGA